MTIQKVTEEELRKVFADTLGKSASFSAILIAYDEENRLPILELGVPYDIVDGALEIGPYLKNILTFPSDYNKRKKSIPIKNIVGYRRLEIGRLFQKNLKV